MPESPDEDDPGGASEMPATMVEATSGGFIGRHNDGPLWRKLMWWIILVGFGALMGGFFGDMGRDLWGQVKSATPRESTDLPDTTVSEGRPSVENTDPGNPMGMQQARTEETSSGVEENTDSWCSKQLLYVKSIPTTATRSVTTREMVLNLLSSSIEADMDCAHKLANSVPSTSTRSITLVSVSDKYVDLMKCAHAVKAAQDIPISSTKSDQLKRVLTHSSCRRL